MNVAYPPGGLGPAVRLFDVGGLPVSLGPVPGCPYLATLWLEGGPQRWGKPDHGFGPNDLPAPNARRVNEAQFRDLITTLLAGY